jgi:hypothetical protein
MRSAGVAGTRIRSGDSPAGRSGTAAAIIAVLLMIWCLVGMC